MTAYLIGKQSDATGSPTVITVGQPVPAGHGILVAGDQSGATTITGITDSAGNTYTAVPGGTAAQNGLAAWQAISAGNDLLSPGDEIEVAWAGSGPAKNAIAIGIPGALAVDQVAAATGTSTAPAVTTAAAIAEAGETCVAFQSGGFGGGAIAWNPPAGPLASAQNGTTQWLAAARLTALSAGKITMSGQIASAPWGLVIVTVKTAAAAADSLALLQLLRRRR